MAQSANATSSSNDCKYQVLVESPGFGQDASSPQQAQQPSVRMNATKSMLRAGTMRLEGDDASSPQTRAEERRLMSLIHGLQKREGEILEQIEDVNRSFELKRRPLVTELDSTRLQLAQQALELDHVRHAKCAEGPPPGPRELRWVEGDIFTFACMVVIISNFVVMVLQMRDPALVVQLWALDQIFLVWYVLELTLKITLHQRRFLIGPFTGDRVFHWLDLVIVLGGVLDQWILPLIFSSGESMPFNVSALRMLRMLRITRMFRLVKALKLLLLMDFSWADGPRFESFTTGIILVNSVTMGLELDFEWPGFHYLNLLFLAIYSFEVVVKLKRHKMAYFSNENATWHWLDFVIVSGGLIETLGLPAYDGIVWSLTGTAPERSDDGGILSLLRIFRLLRILRLYRLLTMNKALKKLVVGIADAMQGTIWVIILTFVILYIFAIVFTTLVGRGVVFAGHTIPEEARETFGSVEKSLYMLFKLMNDDQSVVQFTECVWVRLLFMLSMVVLNWVMLATLTSVVTDHMNSATNRAERIEAQLDSEYRLTESRRKLLHIFRQIDVDNNGFIERFEFSEMLKKPDLRQELSEATGLPSKDLVELFEYLSHEYQDGRVIIYEDFIQKLHSEGQPASERTVFRLEEELRASERRMNQRFENLMKFVQEPVQTRAGLYDNLQVPLPPPDMPRWAKTVNELQEVEKEEERKKEEAELALELAEMDLESAEGDIEADLREMESAKQAAEKKEHTISNV